MNKNTVPHGIAEDKQVSDLIPITHKKTTPNTGKEWFIGIQLR